MESKNCDKSTKNVFEICKYKYKDINIKFLISAYLAALPSYSRLHVTYLTHSHFQMAYQSAIKCHCL